jgi:hypothetical protein
MNATTSAMGCRAVLGPDLAVSMNQHYTNNKYILLSKNNIYHAPHHHIYNSIQKAGYCAFYSSYTINKFVLIIQYEIWLDSKKANCI